MDTCAPHFVSRLLQVGSYGAPVAAGPIGVANVGAFAFDHYGAPVQQCNAGSSVLLNVCRLPFASLYR